MNNAACGAEAANLAAESCRLAAGETADRAVCAAPASGCGSALVPKPGTDESREHSSGSSDASCLQTSNLQA